MCTFTQVEKIGTFGVCLSIAHCLDEVTEEAFKRLKTIASRLGMTKSEVDACLDNPETIPKIVPTSHDVRLCAIECFAYISIENGVVSSVDQAEYILGACNAFEISEEECQAIMKKVAQNDYQLIQDDPKENQINATQKLSELIWCEDKATLEQVEDLLTKGAKPNATYPDGTTLLMVACMTKQHPLVIETLIKAGADVHTTNERGLTALFSACQALDEFTEQSVGQVLRIETINVLLEAGADINHQSGDGPDPEDPYCLSKLTPLHLATNPDSVEVVKFLLEKGADPNIGDGLKRTPLFGAVCIGDIELVVTLIDGGADVDLTCIHLYNQETGKPVAFPFTYSNGEEGHTFEIYPLDFAVMQDEQEIAMLLLSRGAKYTAGLTQLEINMVHESFADDSGSSECHRFN